MLANDSIFPDLRGLDSDSQGIQLLEKLKLVTKSSSGVYCFLPLGTMIITRLEWLIKKKFNEFGCYEVKFPTLMPAKYWEKSARWDSFDSLLKIRDRSNKFLCLNPTHEETSVETINNILHSYKDLPITLFCVNKVYRDEVRTKSGLLRTKEFIMTDSYSFTQDLDSSINDYFHICEIHRSIFGELGLNCIEATADNGNIGGTVSVEFICPDNHGESLVSGCHACNIWTSKSEDLNYLQCKRCGGEKIVHKRGVELAHVFQLGQFYTKRMDVKILNQANRFEYPYMNCSGIGVTRLFQVLIENSFNKDKTIAPSILSPFDILIYHDSSEDITISQNGKNLYNRLISIGYRVLLDTRKIPEKPKLKLADILACKLSIYIGSNIYKIHFNKQVVIIEENEILEYIQKL